MERKWHAILQFDCLFINSSFLKYIHHIEKFNILKIKLKIQKNETKYKIFHICSIKQFELYIVICVIFLCCKTFFIFFKKEEIALKLISNRRINI